MQHINDYYGLLGVSQHCTSAEIETAYRKLTLRYHPDRNSGDKKAEAMMVRINEAREVLRSIHEMKREKHTGNKKQSTREAKANKQSDERKFMGFEPYLVITGLYFRVEWRAKYDDEELPVVRNE